MGEEPSYLELIRMQGASNEYYGILRNYLYRQYGRPIPAGVTFMGFFLIAGPAVFLPTVEK